MSEPIHTKEVPCKGMPVMSRFLLFIALFFIMFMLVSFINNVMNSIEMDARARILVISALQGILVFILPTLIEARLESPFPCKKLTLGKVPSLNAIIVATVCYITGFCFLNQLIYWNENLNLPSSFNAIEQTLRRWEEGSRDLTNIILSDKSWGGLISGILIVGLLTGLAEELFFRAGIQRMLSEVMPSHIAVWISAFIFSAMHFQFFGFIPRFILGVFFGYLYLWSGTIWTAVFAHSLNNSIVVLSAWLSTRGYITWDMETIGVTETGIPYAALLSAVITILIIYIYLSYGKSYIQGNNHGYQ